jgi:hypothetical protein
MCSTPDSWTSRFNPIHMLLPRPLFALLSLASALGLTAAPLLHRDAWSFDRSDLIVYKFSDVDKKRAEGSLSGIGGWVEYDVEVAAAGWHELWIKGANAGSARDVYLDGKVLLWLTTSEPEDAAPGGWLKECNVYLTAGKHTLRLKRLMWAPVLPSQWELRPSNGAAAGSVCVVDQGDKARFAHNAVRLNDTVTLTLEGGRPDAATTYTLVARDESGAMSDLAPVEFPATAQPLRREVSFKFPRQGVFLVLGRENGQLLRPADLKAGNFVVIDTVPAPVADTELRVRNVLDIDCTAEPPAGRFWEKDGASRVVDSPAGRYRESSGQGSVAEWGTDGYSYRFDLPETGALYRIRVDYPDNDRRSMGFWVTDGLGSQTNFTGVINTGGVETGDHYALSGKMLTHEAFFRPRANQDLIVAVLSFVPGLKAAAARIRIDLVESELPPAPAGERGGRSLGFYFEEPGRWLRFFGGNDRSPAEQIKTLERYGQWQRHIGSNLMFATVQVYGGTHYPSRMLDGYMNTPLNETRLAALAAEKYGCRFIPELFLTGQMPFDSRTMGVQGEDGPGVRFLKPGAEDIVLRDRDGNLKCFWKPFAYNPLHPAVQRFYIDTLGELADMLGDTESFAGISSRMMIGWQNQCWNSLPCLDYGYEDWTVNEFSRETGITVPGAPDDPARFRQRFEFLTGAVMRDKWMDWRCARLFAFHRRLRDRIRQAKPSANLYFTYFPRDKEVEYSDDLIGKMREQGIDCALYKNESGIQLVPGMTYGRRFSTPLADAVNQDPDYDEQLKSIALSGDRATGIFGLYFEVNKNLDWTKLGAPAGLNAFDASVPAGRAELAGYATALADSDPSLIVTGGNGWMFGTSALMRPFLREYRALPAKPFTRLENATDPVAVWQHRDDDGTLWFYAVNRLAVPVTAELKLAGPSPRVRPAAGGDALALADNRLTFALEPHMLKSFRAQASGLSDFKATVPPGFVAGLRSQMNATEPFRADLKARRLVPEASAADVEAAVKQLDVAEQAFSRGEYWTAEGQLKRAAVTKIEYGSGRYIPGVLERSLPMGVPNFSDQVPAGFRVVLADAPGRLTAVRDLTYDAEGHLWVASGEGLSEFDAAGKWMRTLTLFNPYNFGNGDVRYGALPPPRLLLPDVIRAVSEHRMLVQAGGAAPMLVDTRDGRVLPLAMGDKYFTNSGAGRLLDARPDGTAMISIGDSEPTAGVSLYAADGTFLRRLTREPALAGAFDADGNQYLATKSGIVIYDRNGAKTVALPESGVSRLQVSADGDTLVMHKGKSAIIVGRRDSRSGWVTSETMTLSGAISSLGLSPQGGLAVGYARAESGAMVRSYEFAEPAMKSETTLVFRAEPGASPAITDYTQLKVYRGTLYFIGGGKLMRLVKGVAETAFEPRFSNPGRPAFEAFAFGPEGDLYLASHWQGSQRGVNVYRCRKSAEGWSAPEYLNGGKPVIEGGKYVTSDLGVDAQGRLLFMGGSTNPPQRLKGGAIGLFRWNPADATPPEMILELGAPQVSNGEIGLHALPDGGWLVAGGNIRSIWRLNAQGNVVWESTRLKSCPPGYPELRCPLGIAADARGRIWVTDPTRHQILKLDLETGRPLETMGSFGDGTDATRLQMNQPSGIAIITDVSGREWVCVADAGNRRMFAFPVD